MFTFNLYSSAGYAPTITPGLAVAALVGETLEVRVAGNVVSSVTAIVNPGSGASVDTATITFSAAGKYRFKVVTATETATFDVTCCETTCPAKLPANKSTAEKRQILTNMAGYAEWFTGLASEIPVRNLAPFGG